MTTASITRPTDLPASNHYASTDRHVLAKEYAYLYPLAQIVKFSKEAADSAQFALTNKNRFLEAAQSTLVPWFVIATINHMEQGESFSGTILNGDPWTQKTKHFPSGFGPWRSWSEATVFAIAHEQAGYPGYDFKTWTWDLPGCFYFLELWNGFNSRLPEGNGIVPDHASPYLYSGTQFYQSGKRVEDLVRGRYVGRFDPGLVSSQVGCMAFLKALEAAGEKLFT